MSKSKKNTRPAKMNPRMLWMGAAAVVVVIAALVVIIASQPAAATTAAGLKITPADYQTQFVSTGAPHLLLDVRTPEEFVSGHIRGSVNIAVEELEQRLSEIPRDQMVIVYCRSGRRSEIASGILSTAGYTQIRDLGGINAWIDAGLPVE
jgi:rhodanese-related sulfurtransferase